ncbi:MAG: acyltransferase family protein [Micromonosporaceae bacterium]
MASSHDSLVRSRQRELWADNLRVLVVAGVIVVHTATGYLTGFADWYYDELTTSTVWSTLLSFPVAAGGLFGLGPLFLLAGWFSPRSLAHRGPGGFARSRLLRLGVPLLAFMLLVQPLADYVGSRPDEVRTSFASALRTTEFSVMWFVAALLVFSLVYAALRRLRPAPQSRRPLRLGVLLAAAALTIAVTSFVVWQVWPWNSNVLHTARLGEWPQGAVLFALGVHAAETGWLEDLPLVVARRLGRVALVGTIATVTLFAVLEARDEATAVLNAATGWPTMLFALLDGMVAVSLTLWFISWVRRRWPSHGPLLGKAARASYAAYIIHPLVLTTVMVLFASAALAPEIKFVLVAMAGAAACFVVGHALTRVPGISKVL